MAGLIQDTVGEPRILAEGLKFPEGPVALGDGSVLVAEIAGGTITRVSANGESSLFARTGGGPNGMAIGPNRKLFVCNNGGNEYGGSHFTATGPARDYAGGYIQTVDLDTGEVKTLYDRIGEHKLSSPNDIVFDAHGGFYFTDMGKRHHTHRDNGGLYYAMADGSRIVEVVYPLLTPNGVGLSPDGKTVYVSDTETSRLIAFDIIAPGSVVRNPFPAPYGGRLVCGLPGFQRFDSLAIDAAGNICVGTLMTGHITIVSPSGDQVRQVKMPEIYPTNLCFSVSGDPKLYVTLSAEGELAEFDWPTAGLSLQYSA